jgi:hypothetical protein
MMDADINKSTLRKLATLVTDEEAEQPQLSGDYAAEGGLADRFRRAEIWVPDEVWADPVSDEVRNNMVQTDGSAWYATHFQVGILPPDGTRVSSAEIRLLFDDAVLVLGGWYPNDVFSVYREVKSRQGVSVEARIAPDNPLLKVVPDLQSLLPQVSAEYSRFEEQTKAPEDSVVRTISDGQRRLAFQLRVDPKTDKDPRHFRGQVLFGVSLDPRWKARAPAIVQLTLTVSCRCGVLRPRSAIEQLVDVALRDRIETSG